jgi:hypothetical protein
MLPPLVGHYLGDHDRDQLAGKYEAEILSILDAPGLSLPIAPWKK